MAWNNDFAASSVVTDDKQSSTYMFVNNVFVALGRKLSLCSSAVRNRVKLQHLGEYVAPNI